MAEKKRCSFNWTWTSNVPTKNCADIPFPFNAQHLFKQIWVWLLHLWCSQLHFDIVPLSDPFLYYPSFSIQCSKPRIGEPIFPPGTCMINVWTCNLYEELALQGWHMITTLVWWNKNLDSCTNSTKKIFWATVIVSPTSLEFKMLQEGFARMQDNVYATYILKAGSNLFTWDKW
jgi:hypothetical protein